ncbi:S-adenosyl-L-methionine-dependent methyltransferase [Gigaspora margarita]|uniref:S-adenosyl-L-methionine-dependent methyltransferase n=1 Tax=Gigaspora margarita TaxID=4874 RepID=A0A8H4B489_GIGMA|nr:S-adenosyl-L-methionine-dependent methyltransferase [Gigaspora margarita]
MGIAFSKFIRAKKAGFDTTSQYLYTITGTPNIYDREQENVALRHNIVREIWGSNFLSPISCELRQGGLRVLDVGCGFGIWLFEMSSEFPNCSYVGVDMSPQLFIANKPKNVEFVLADVKDELPFPDDYFDFIFIRNMGFDLLETQWISLILECSRVLKSGGYFEITEAELRSMNDGPTLIKLSKKFHEYIASTKINTLIVEKIENFLKSTNKFQDIVHHTRPFLEGSWGGTLKDSYKSYSTDIFRSVLKFSDVKEKDYDDTIKILMDEATVHKTYFNLHKFVSKKV